VSSRFASARISIAECDICGFRFRLRELKSLVVKGKDTNIKACCECWNPDHPQLHLGERPIYDPQAVRNPRPDFTGYPQSRAWIQPSGAVTGTGFIGSVTIVIT